MKWPLAALGDIAQFTNGFAFKPADWSDGGARIVRIQNLTDDRKPYNRTARLVADRYRVHPGDLLVSWSATLGVFEWKQPDVAVLNQHIFRVSPDELKVQRDYLRHMLVGALADMERHLHGATMKHVNRAEFLGTAIPLPPLDEQRRIARVLDRADVLRARRQDALDVCNDLSAALFAERFGSGQGEKARHRVAELRDVCVRITDGTHQSPTWTPNGVPFLFVRNIVRGEIDWAVEKHISAETHAELTRRCPIDPGDVLYSTVGSYGVPVVVRTQRKFAFQRHIAHLKPDHELLDSEYLRAALASLDVRRQADRVARGVAQKTVNLAEIQRFRIPLPPLSEQKGFAKASLEIVRVRDRMRSHSAHLEGLYSSLQYRAFEGAL